MHVKIIIKKILDIMALNRNKKMKKKLNEEYRENHRYTIWLAYVYPINNMEFEGKLYNFRNRCTPNSSYKDDMYIYDRNCNYISDLPVKYFYSSGCNNLCGYIL